MILLIKKNIMISSSLTAEEFKSIPQIQRNIKNFKILVDGARSECFPYLDKKTLEAFKLVPDEQRRKDISIFGQKRY